MDVTYHLSGGFKPTMKRFADLDGPDFFPTPRWATCALADTRPEYLRHANNQHPVEDTSFTCAGKAGASNP